MTEEEVKCSTFEAPPLNVEVKQAIRELLASPNPPRVVPWAGDTVLQMLYYTAVQYHQLRFIVQKIVFFASTEVSNHTYPPQLASRATVMTCSLRLSPCSSPAFSGIILDLEDYLYQRKPLRLLRAVRISHHNRSRG